jgi:hypothetical protein
MSDAMFHGEIQRHPSLEGSEAVPGQLYGEKKNIFCYVSRFIPLVPWFWLHW